MLSVTIKLLLLKKKKKRTLQREVSSFLNEVILLGGNSRIMVNIECWFVNSLFS